MIAAAIEAPHRRNADGSVVLNENGFPNLTWTKRIRPYGMSTTPTHQKAKNFKQLKVLDCFMGGGTTLVEGSRLGFQMSGVDLNPVAWFVVKNELTCIDPEDLQPFLDAIESEVKPQIQPFYVTEEPDHTPGKWFDVKSGKQVNVDPETLPHHERRKYRYEGAEVIPHLLGQARPLHPAQTAITARPFLNSLVIAEKKLGVKYMELTCKQCRTAFHAELGSARMAPGVERVILDNEHPFSELSQPFAKRLLDYAKGNLTEQFDRVFELLDMVDDEPGLMCPACGNFAGEWMRNVLRMHRSAERASRIDKKHLKILPARNGKKPVFSYLLVHPDWLKGASGDADGVELGGYADGTPDENSAWYTARLKNLRLIEVRGRIKLSEDTSTLGVLEGAKSDQYCRSRCPRGRAGWR